MTRFTLALLCFGIFGFRHAQAQPASPSGLVVSGLSNQKLLTSLYQGEFVEIDLDRSDILFMSLYSEYLNAYGRHCAASLPANKVEIMETVCAQQYYNVDRFGNRVGTPTCVSYRTVGTGIYADPALYSAKQQLDDAAGVDTMRQAFKTMTGKNPLGAALNTLSATQAIASDMNALVRLNPCAGPGLKRFQENLMLFALNKQPVRLAGAGGAPAAANRPSPEIPSANQNFTKLMEDLVVDQSKTWVMNRFVNGSISNVVVSSRDAAGRPSKVTGSYLFNGQRSGSVTIGFSNGLPECMYFFDFPSTCRTPNRRIVDAYAHGAYRQ